MAEDKKKVKFYRGSYGVQGWVEKYATDPNGVYFNKVTKTIAVDNNEFGGYTDKIIKDVDIRNGKLVYTVYDPATKQWSPNQVEILLVKAKDNSITVTPSQDEFTGVEVNVNIAEVAEGNDGLKLGENGLYVDLTKTNADIASLKSTTYNGKEAITIEDRTIALKLAESENVLSQSADGLISSISLTYNSETDAIELYGKDATTPISTVDASSFVVDGFLESVEVKTIENKETLVFTWNTDAGKDTTEIDLSKYINVYKAGDGLALDDHTFSVKRDATSEEFLTVGADGVKISGIKDFVQEKIDESLTWIEFSSGE